jgi:hypothetical protein
MITPDQPSVTLRSSQSFLSNIRYFSSAVEFTDLFANDNSIIERPFAVLHPGWREESGRTLILPEGYFKVFTPGIERWIFQSNLGEIYRPENAGRAYAIPQEEGFLGARWRKTYSSSDILEAVGHRCEGRCNPPTTCKEAYCVCNPALGRCV